MAPQVGGGFADGDVGVTARVGSIHMQLSPWD